MAETILIADDEASIRDLAGQAFYFESALHLAQELGDRWGRCV